MEPQHTSINWKVVIGAFVVLGVLIVLGLKESKQRDIGGEQNNRSVVEWPSEQIRTETVTDMSKGYEINAVYPVTKSETITSVFRNFVNDQIASFKTDTDVAQLPEGYRAVTLDITYEQFKNEAADTYVFLSYSDTGGAHGLSATTTFSFSKTGQRIEVADLFTNGVRGLGPVADYVQKELLKGEFADKAWIAEGAAPQKENYRNFIIAPEGVTFIFDQYQVAPYAAGVQKVLVPLSVFKTVANPEIF